MKKVLLSSVFLLLISIFANAQKGKNQINIGPEVDVPIGTFSNAYKIGFGGTVKGLYGVGDEGQITFMTGFSTFKGKSGTTNGYSYANQTYNIIPYLFGYRKNFKTLYIEPQIGFASYKTKVTGYNFNETRLTYGLGVGYSVNALELGLRFQSHVGSSLFALRAAYNLNLKKKK
jgi:hypothetical protein